MDSIVKIIFSDRHIVACVKPAGISAEDELPELLRQQLNSEIFCIHRLDRNVGGVILYARTKQAAGKLSAMIADRSVRKEYLAVTEGIPAEASGSFEDLLFHDSGKNKSYVVKRMRKGVRDAKLDYVKAGETEDHLALCHILLHTGRTHQIRVQFASRKLPLVGDPRYGSRNHSCDTALWSYRMSFIHPFTKKKITVSELPDPSVYPWNQFVLDEGLEENFGN